MDPLNPFGQPQAPLFPWMAPKSKNDLAWDMAQPAKLLDEQGGPGAGRGKGPGAPVTIGDPTGGPSVTAFEDPGQRKPGGGADSSPFAPPPAGAGAAKPYTGFPPIDPATGTPALQPPGAMPTLKLGPNPSLFDQDRSWFDSKAATAPAGTQIPTRPGSMEDYIAKITGVAYGQAPMQFDPNLRMTALQMALHDTDQNQARSDKQAMANFGLSGKVYEGGQDNASKERIAGQTNATHLSIAQLQDPKSSMRADMLLKLGLLKQQDPNLDLQRLTQTMGRITGLVDNVLPNGLANNLDPTPRRPLAPGLMPGSPALPGSAPNLAPDLAGVEKGLSGPLMRPGAVPAPAGTTGPTVANNPLGGDPAQLDARERRKADFLNAIRSGLGKQGSKGFELDPTKLGDDEVLTRTLGQLGPLMQGMDPATRQELAGQLQSGEAMGDPGELRRRMATLLAEQQLIGGGTPFKDGAAASSYTVGSDGQKLFDLRVKPSTGAKKFMETLGSPILGRKSQVPYDEIALPGGEVIPFNRGGVSGLGRTLSSDDARKKRAAELMGQGVPLYQLLLGQQGK